MFKVVTAPTAYEARVNHVSLGCPLHTSNKPRKPHRFTRFIGPQPAGKLPKLGHGDFRVGLVGCFFARPISVLTTTYSVEHKVARDKQAQPSH